MTTFPSVYICADWFMVLCMTAVRGPRDGSFQVLTGQPTIDCEVTDILAYSERQMTTSSSLSGRFLAPRPPSKGSFPLDHLGECKPLAKLYNACLQNNDGAASQCRALAREYLQCRMKNGLMAKEDLSKLGISPDTDASFTASSKDHAQKFNVDRSKEKEGFVAGIRTARRRASNTNGSVGMDTDEPASGPG